MRPWRRHFQRPAFSLIELLVVMAIIAILAGLTLPAVQRARETANRIRCQNNLHQMALAAHQYEAIHKALPPSRMANASGTWAVLLLPHIEQQPLYAAWDLGLPYYKQTDLARETTVPLYFCPSRRDPGGLSLAGDIPVDSVPIPDWMGNARRLAREREKLRRPPQPPLDIIRLPLPGTGGGGGTGVIIVTPKSPPPPPPPHFPGALGDYACNLGTTGFDYSTQDDDPDGPFFVGKSVGSPLSKITDGLSNTLMIGEKHVPRGKERLPPWDGALYNAGNKFSPTRSAGPRFPLATNPRDQRWLFGSAHQGICNFAFCDGSVRAVSTDIDPVALGRLGSARDGAVAPPVD